MSEAPKYNNTPPDQRSGGVLRFLGGFAGGGHSSGGAAASIRSCSMLVRRTPRSYSVSRMSWSIPVTASWPTAALRVCRAARYPRWKASFPPPKPSPRGEGGPAHRGGSGGECPLRRSAGVAVGRWSGSGPAQVSPCEVVPRPVPGGGSRLSLEKARTQRVAGGYPPPPLFYGPLVPTRSFWRLWHIVPVVGLFRCPSACPDLDSHFAGAGVGRESFSLRRHTTYEGFPLGGSCHRR